MQLVHPDLVRGRTVPVRDERHNPLGTLYVSSASGASIRLARGTLSVEIPAKHLIHFHPSEGLTLQASALGPDLLAALAARQATTEDAR